MSTGRLNRANGAAVETAVIAAWGGSNLELRVFVSAYEQSIVAFNREAQELKERIARIERKCEAQPACRLSSRIGLYQHQLASLKQKHRGASCWVATVVQPIFAIISKRLGSAYRGTLTRISDSQASLRFAHSALGHERTLVLKVTMARLCTEPLNESAQIMVERSIVLPASGRADENLPLETTISEVLAPLSRDGISRD